MSSSGDQLRPGVVKVCGSGPHKFPHLCPLKVSSREEWSCTCVQSGSSMDSWPVWEPSHNVSHLLRHSMFCYPKWHVCFCLHWKLIRANQHFDLRDHQMPGHGVFYRLQSSIWTGLIFQGGRRRVKWILSKCSLIIYLYGLLMECPILFVSYFKTVVHVLAAVALLLLFGKYVIK